MKEILVRPERCVGCRSCEIACAVEHSQSRDLLKALSEMPQRRLYVEHVPEYSLAVPMLCRHCEDAPCVAVCPTGALTQDALTGVVRHNRDICIGCWTCASVCTYGVIGRDRRARVAIKCDRCPDREVPACVSACPTRALIYGEVEEVSRARRAAPALKFAQGVAASSR
ncbi:MAG: 4Fe-4S dicluster domain-containing protein [Methanothrix sp.]|uniref:4Fe-4S dicluster domain-containing protein n=1 Tax=Methanothrix sp. TaxID=90426 RepID=UPI00260013F7|nr:4Fe-4S dicluster domain-containing protein [Methanothrix sp.]MCQ8903408.1 4Fe-4S dicluster domain-containing protein [Methanothrix sp.]